MWEDKPGAVGGPCTFMWSLRRNEVGLKQSRTKTTGPRSQGWTWSKLVPKPVAPKIFQIWGNKFPFLFNVVLSSSLGSKESSCNSGGPSSIPGSWRSPGEGTGYPLQDSWAPCGSDTKESTSCLTFATPWTVVCQAPLSMEFSRQEYWSG